LADRPLGPRQRSPRVSCKRLPLSDHIAIVGGGLAALTAYATLRHAGLEAAEIAVLGTDDDPAAVWRRRAVAIRQTHMRSESDGHAYPTNFPGLAPREALRRRTATPLIASVLDRYRPTVDEFLAHVDRLRSSSGWDESFRRERVERVRAVDGGFELDGGIFAHVLVAPGHAGLAYPDVLRGDPRVVHAYEPHEYASRVAVVGAGMAAATEWLNALASGSEVVSVRRREPERRPLNLPRPLFTKRGLAAFHASGAGARTDLLRRFSAPSYPPGRAWDEPIEAAAREGRFRVEAEVDGAEQIVCATGFLRGYRNDQLLARLVDEHGLETADRWIVLADDSTVPGLTDSRRTLALVGAPAQWAYPAADTLVGMKVAARWFTRRVVRCRTR
jgi:cation diffusion facilitator CzcD-associated flavoprotein CzcO